MAEECCRDCCMRSHETCKTFRTNRKHVLMAYKPLQFSHLQIQVAKSETSNLINRKFQFSHLWNVRTRCPVTPFKTSKSPNIKQANVQTHIRMRAYANARSLRCKLAQMSGVGRSCGTSRCFDYYGNYRFIIIKSDRLKIRRYTHHQNASESRCPFPK